MYVIYNILNKRAESQSTPGRRNNNLLHEVAPYLTRTRALLFAFDVDNKSYNGAKHNYECE